MQSNRPIVQPPNRQISWLWTDRGFSPCDSVPLTDRGFRYGMSVFESFPVRKKTPFFLRQHLQRLEKSCAQVGFKTGLPTSGEIEKLARTVPFDGFARIYVTAGDADVYRAAGHCRVYFFIEPRTPGDAADCKLALHPEPHTPIFGGLKTANYWPNIAALQTARGQNCDEALLFDIRCELVSACMANVFAVRDGKIKTPALSGGARDGVIREWVMHRRDVGESSLTGDDLKNADEIFLTSSWLGIMPAASLDGRKLASRPVADALRVEYEQEVSACHSVQGEESHEQNRT